MSALVHGEGQGSARVALGAGVMLRQAREARNLTREAVAARTRLELRVIEALESENYQSLAASAFVRGYIRSVAKELQIDPLPVLAQYEQYVHAEEPALADFTTRSPAQITSSSTLIRGISVGLLAVVVGLVAVWWRYNYQSGPESEAGLAKLSAQANTVVPTDPGTPLPYAYTIVDHSNQPLDRVNSWRHQTDGTTPPSMTDEPSADIESPEAAEAAPTAESPPTPRSASTPIVDDPNADLILQGDTDAWVEISDVTGKRLFFGMLKPSQRVALAGKAPYDLVIGNASAVRVTFRGKPVDVQHHALNGVARFALGEPN